MKKKNRTMCLSLISEYYYTYSVIIGRGNKPIHKPALFKLVEIYLKRASSCFNKKEIKEQKQILNGKIKEI